MEKLPLELLTEILLYSISSKQRKCRRRLSLVCSLWINLVSSVQLFWTDVGLQRSRKELDEIMHRNPNGPLDISWTPSKPYKEMDSETLQKYNVARAESRRWRALKFAGYVSDEMEQDLINLDAPNLLSLEICFSSMYDDDDTVLQGITPLQIGRSLRELVLGNASMDWPWPPLAGLRVLRLDSLGSTWPTLMELHQMLSNSPVLEILGLSNWTSDPINQDEISQSLAKLPMEPAILLPSLSTLIIDKVDPDLTAGALALIKAPQCQYLHVRNLKMTALRDILHPANTVEMLSAPFRKTSHQLFLKYDHDTGAIAIGMDEELACIAPGIRYQTRKLSRSRGIHIEIVPGEGEEVGHSPERDELVSTFVKDVIQPSFAYLGLEVQLEIWDSSNFAIREPPNRPNLQLLDHLSFVTRLKLAETYFYDAGKTIRYLSEPKGPSGWPLPKLREIVVEWDELVFRPNNTIRKLDVLGTRRLLASCIESSDEVPAAAIDQITLLATDEYTINSWDPEGGWKEDIGEDGLFASLYRSDDDEDEDDVM
ncbi:hypothetical protein FRB90_006860 [Tulasnella sp. 427]|nr:hypothetical protein FRB90_006860 [Tulasnella sp. 427]